MHYALNVRKVTPHNYARRLLAGKVFIGASLLMMYSSWLTSVQMAAVETISNG